MARKIQKEIGYSVTILDMGSSPTLFEYRQGDSNHRSCVAQALAATALSLVGKPWLTPGCSPYINGDIDETPAENLVPHL